MHLDSKTFKLLKMKDLFILTAAAMPEEDLLNEIQEALNDYKTIPSEENQRALSMFCIMFHLKCTTNGDLKQAMNLINGIDNVNKKMSIFDTNEN